MYRKRFRFPVMVLLCFLLFSWKTAESPTASAEALGGTPPTTLVSSGVTNFNLAEPRVVWHTSANCTEPPGLVAEGAAPEDPEIISRIPNYGGLIRQIFFRNEDRPVGECNPYHIYSNVVADGDYAYWASDNGLVRLSLEANPTDEPELMSASIKSTANNNQVILAQSENFVYAITYNSASTSRVWRVQKSNLDSALVDEVAGLASSLSATSEYSFWIANGTLWRAYFFIAGFTVEPIATGVSSYHAEGTRVVCLIGCYTTDYVFIGKGRSIVRYDNETNTTSATLYTSNHPEDPTFIFSMTSDLLNVYFLEARAFYPCPGCFQLYDQILFRMSRAGGTATPLYEHQSPLALYVDLYDLQTDWEYLYWQEADSVLKLPNNAEALPQTNMHITRLEVTQGIQDINNSIDLIGNRRTFVRAYAQADGQVVGGVTAWLYRVSPINNAVLAGPLAPVNYSGTHLPVFAGPLPQLEDGSFVFELPLDWVQTGQALKLMVVLNPYNTPLESNPNDNTAYSSVFTPIPSPRLGLKVYAIVYDDENNLTYSPWLQKDVLQTFSWIRRAYPLASDPYSNPYVMGGLDASYYYIGVDSIYERINQTHPDCQELDAEDRNSCAAIYMNSLLHAWQDQDEEADDTHEVYYAMMPDDAGFPRGKGGGGVASGPASAMCCGASWDTDGSITDWYSGHEIGHALGREHPVAGSALCGHSDDDGDFPYTESAIGPYNGDGTELGIVWGFDLGDPSMAIKRQVAPSSIWRDMMGYCDFQWISDYTYTGLYEDIYDFDDGEAPVVRLPAGGGEVLRVYGVVYPNTQVAHFHYLQLQDGGTSVPSIIPGDYAIRLLNAQSQVLAEYAFTPEGSDEASSAYNFGQVVAFVPGAAKVQIVHLASNTVWAEEAISSNAPVVNNVSMNATQPVTGTATLTWLASDADGDTLTYEVSYSRDGGASFEHLTADLSQTQYTFDANWIAGGSTIFRVTANDGVLANSADSAPITIANKPPQPIIYSPGNDTHIEWGQLVTFMGEGLDAQDGSVDPANLVWSNQYGQLGSGTLFSLTDLPVGINEITLTATNSAGLSASTTITVVVEDDLDLSQPALAVGPNPIGWHVATGSATVQQTVVTVVNVGGGVMESWTAESDVEWLTLQVTDGGMPGSLTVSTDPSGLPDGTSRSATIIITADFDNGETQTVTLPVHLSVGDVYSPVIYQLFLPVVTN